MDIDKYLDEHPNCIVLGRCRKCGYVGTGKRIYDEYAVSFIYVCKHCRSARFTYILVIEIAADGSFKIIYKKRK